MQQEYDAFHACMGFSCDNIPVFRVKIYGLSAQDLGERKGHPATYKNYDPEDMVDAVHRDLNPSQAHKMYSVPRSTVAYQRNHPPRTHDERLYLSDGEEQVLLTWVMLTYASGFPAMPAMIKAKAVAMMQIKLKEPHGMLDKWWEGFRQRHNDVLKELRVSARSTAERQALDPAALNEYYDKLEDTVRRHKLTPDKIYNMDESTLAKLGGHRTVVVVPRWAHNVKATINIVSEHITIVTCIRADGKVVAPLFLFKGNYSTQPRSTSMGGAPQDSQVAFTRKQECLIHFNGRCLASAFMTSALFQAWLEVFIGVAKPTPENPVLLLLDNHSSRYNSEMREMAAKAGVILFMLPANSTYRLQPLDFKIFGEFKRSAHHAIDLASLSGQDVNKHNLVQFISSAWIRAVNPLRIRAAFAETGVWPVNRNIVMDEVKRSVSLEPFQAHMQLGQAETKTSKQLPDNQLPVLNELRIPDRYKEVLIIPHTPNKNRDHGFAKVQFASDLDRTIVKHAAERERKKKKHSTKSKSTAEVATTASNSSDNAMQTATQEEKTDGDSSNPKPVKRKRVPPAETVDVSADEPRTKRQRYAPHSLLCEEAKDSGMEDAAWQAAREEAGKHYAKGKTRF